MASHRDVVAHPCYGVASGDRIARAPPVYDQPGLKKRRASRWRANTRQNVRGDSYSGGMLPLSMKQIVSDFRQARMFAAGGSKFGDLVDHHQCFSNGLLKRVLHRLALWTPACTFPAVGKPRGISKIVLITSV